MTVSRSAPTPDHCREQAGLEVLVTPKEDQKNTPNLENIALKKKKKNHYSWLFGSEERRDLETVPLPSSEDIHMGSEGGRCFLK